MRLHRLLVPITLAVIVLDAALLATGTITPRTAVVLLLAVEVPLGLVSVTVLIVRIRAAGLRAGVAELPGGPLIVAEVGALVTLARALRGVDDGAAPDTRTFTARTGALLLPSVVAALTVLELGAVSFLVPWRWAEIVLAVLGVYGAVMVAAYTTQRWVYPHLLTPESLVVRLGRRSNWSWTARLRLLCRRCGPHASAPARQPGSASPSTTRSGWSWPVS